MSDTTSHPFARPTGLHHVRLSVTDVARSKAFYSALLGSEPALDNTDRVGEPGVVDDPAQFFGGCVFEVGGNILGLRPVPGAAGERFSPQRPGLDHVSLAVAARSDLDDAAERLAAAGVEHGEVIEIEGQGIAVLSLQDPDDINLELTAPLR